MKKYLLLFVLAIIAFSSFAQLKSGYYRVYNVGDGRYIHITDNTGSVSATKQDLSAVHLIKKFEEAVSAPSSVVYFNFISGENYDLVGQGTSVKTILGYTPKVRYESRVSAYRIGADSQGVQVWLGSDTNYKTDKVGYVSITESGQQVLWKIDPIDANSDNYFGITPTVEVGGKYYAAFYAAFPFSFASSGMKAYYVSESSNGEAKMVEIDQKVLPASTPMIIECSSAEPTNNRLNILTSGGTAISGNLLNGTYFANTGRQSLSASAVVKFDNTKMRVLGKTKDGKLGFVSDSDKNLYTKSKVKYISANTAYFYSDAAIPSELLLLPSNEYSSITQVTQEESISKMTGVYSILGVKVRDKSSLEGLPAGIYVVNGRKVVKR